MLSYFGFSVTAPISAQEIESSLMHDDIVFLLLLLFQLKYKFQEMEYELMQEGLAYSLYPALSVVLVFNCLHLHPTVALYKLLTWV